MQRLLLILVLAAAVVITCNTWLQGKWPVNGECMLQVSPAELEKNLRQHVWVLAEDIGERHFQQPGSLDRAADYIQSVFSATGLDIEHQEYGDGYRNLLVTITEGRPGIPQPREMIVVGAHYDTVWLTAGADDNASGVAVLLELARMLNGQPLAKTIQLVAFTNEEYPFAETAMMGSRIYVDRVLSTGRKINAMYSLEMVGYFSDEAGSQRYPFPLNLVYPRTGNFIAFVGNLRSTRLLLQSLSAFRQHSAFPVQGLAMSERLIPDIRRSDHASFQDAGIASLMLTDTAFYRNERYHTVGDLARTLDYKKMAQFTHGLACMLTDIAGINDAD